MAEMRLRYSKLVEYVESSKGAYTLRAEGEKVSLLFVSQLSDTKEHYEGAVIKIQGNRVGDYFEITAAEMDYGGGVVRKISLESLVPWLLSVDEQAEL